jgi:hypothetical protein
MVPETGGSTMEAKTIRNMAFVVLYVLLFGITTGWLGGL